MWELKASKVSSSVIVTVWLAQIGHAVVSAWLPCSSLHHGTEQPCTKHVQAHSSHQITPADTRATRWLFGKRAQQMQCFNAGAERTCHVCSFLFGRANTRVWRDRACDVRPQNPKQTSSCSGSLMARQLRLAHFIHSYFSPRCVSVSRKWQNSNVKSKYERFV